MKVMMAGAALLLGAGGALAQVASKVDAAKAYDTLIACFEAEADQLDDRHSDARTIASATSLRCRDAIRAVHAARRGVPTDSAIIDEDMASAELKAWFLDRAIVATLERRAARKR